MSVFKNLPAAPVAPKKPVTDTRHGMTRTDDYAWLRAENWQAMFKDPSILDPEIRRHLEAENTYMNAAMADTKDLQKTLFAEMRGRIKEDDSSVPMKDGPLPMGRLTSPAASIRAISVSPRGCSGRRDDPPGAARRRQGG